MKRKNKYDLYMLYLLYFRQVKFQINFNIKCPCNVFVYLVFSKPWAKSENDLQGLSSFN